MLGRRGQRFGRFDRHRSRRCPLGPMIRSGSPTAAVDLQIEPHAPLRLRAGERLSQPGRELRVVGLPDLLARLQAAKSIASWPKAELDVAAAWRCTS